MLWSSNSSASNDIVVLLNTAEGKHSSKLCIAGYCYWERQFKIGIARFSVKLVDVGKGGLKTIDLFALGVADLALLVFCLEFGCGRV